MTGHQGKKPTDAELEILRVLWERGPSTVREVFRILQERRGAGYTTVLKLMQIMTEKGLLKRDTTVRPQIYEAICTRGQMQRQLLGDLLERAFGGSPGRLVLQALSEKQTTPEERRAIRELLDELEREGT
jgi:BlaI family penicillinase repressor